MKSSKTFIVLGFFWIIWMISIPIVLTFIKIEKSTKIVLFVLYILVSIIIFIILAFIEKRDLKASKVFADEERRIAEEQRKAEELAARQAQEELEGRILSSPIRNLTPLQFEEFTALYFKKRGYTNIDLTPVSGDFGADIIAYNPEGKKVCIQCKKYSSPVGVSAVQEILSAKLYYKCEIAMVAVGSAGFTRQAKELARKTEVILYTFDDVLHEFILEDK